MSLMLITSALNDTRTAGAARLVLCVLADMADQAGVCWPGYAQISQRANVARRTAIRAIAWLEEQGFLVVTRRLVGEKQYRSNLYRVCIPGEGGDITPREEAAPCAAAPSRQDSCTESILDVSPGL